MAPIPLFIYDLEPYDPKGFDHRSVCPVCKDGLLLGTRDIGTGEFSAFDSCILCGQQFQYLDIELVRKNHGRSIANGNK